MLILNVWLIRIVKGHQQRQRLERQRTAAVIIQSCFRMYAQRKR